MEQPKIVEKTAEVKLPAATKPALYSKTLWMALVTALLPIVYPPAAVWSAAHPELVTAALGAVFGGLRVVSDGKIVVK